jgi:hypothetical protein
VSRLRALHLLIGLGVLLGLAGSVRAADRVLLVVGARSPVEALNSVEVHKMFLGLTVVVDGRRLRGLRNDADDLMRQVFFQSIVSMSESVYDRRMLTLTLQQGRTPPPVFRSTRELFDALDADPDAVSFAWGADVARDRRIKALRVLWQP